MLFDETFNVQMLSDFEFLAYPVVGPLGRNQTTPHH
jgi:hypothetical protein